MKKEENIWDEVHRKLKNDTLKHSEYAEISEKLFPRNSLICDLGGGLGFDAIYFIRCGHKVVILDISKFALKHAQDLARQEKFTNKLLVKQVDFGLGKLPLRDNSLDVIYSRFGLNYFPFRETQLLFSEVNRVLKPGGSSFLVLKSQEDSEEMKFLRENAIELEEGVFIKGEQVRSRFSISQLESMLKEIGAEYFVVKPYREDVRSKDETGVEASKTLYFNEVSITKKPKK